MSYNKKMFREMVEESKKKKVLPKPKDRIVDPMGQWAHPGQVTRIPSNRITMQGVPYPVLGVGNNGQQQMMYPGQEYSFPGSQYVDEYPLMQAQNGAIIDPGDDELAFQRFFKTLPFNLRVDNPSYNIRGYWNALGRPEKFDYSQPKEDDGMYHAFSRNPNTGEILKRPQHPTFKMAIEGDRAAGYYPIVTPDGKIKTVSGRDFKPGQSIYFNGGDISIPNLKKEGWLNKYDNGGQLEKFKPGGFFTVPTTTKFDWSTVQRLPTKEERDEYYAEQGRNKQNKTARGQIINKTKTTTQNNTSTTAQNKTNQNSSGVSSEANPNYNWNMTSIVPEWTTNTQFPTSNKIPININYEDIVRRGDLETQTGTGRQVLLNKAIASQNIANQKFEKGVAALMSSGMSEESAIRTYQEYIRNPKLLPGIGWQIDDIENRNYRISMHPDYDPNKSFDQQKYLATDGSLRARLLRGSNMLNSSGDPVLNFLTGAITAPGRAFANLTTNANQRYLNSDNSILENVTNLGLDLLDVTGAGIFTPKNAAKLVGNKGYTTALNLYGDNIPRFSTSGTTNIGSSSALNLSRNLDNTGVGARTQNTGVATQNIFNNSSDAINTGVVSPKVNLATSGNKTRAQIQAENLRRMAAEGEAARNAAVNQAKTTSLVSREDVARNVLKDDPIFGGTEGGWGRTGSGNKSLSYDDMVDRLHAEYAQNDVLALGNYPVYFHGTTSGSLPGIVKNQGLIPTGKLISQGDIPLTGELSFGSLPGIGMNNENLSAAFIGDINSSLNYAGGKNFINPIQRLETWNTVDRPEVISWMPENQIKFYDELLTNQANKWQTLSQEEKLLAEENFPILFGIRPKGADRFSTIRTSIDGEVGIKGGVGFNEIPSVYVPKSKIEYVSQYFGNPDRMNILPIDELLLKHNQGTMPSWWKWKKGGTIGQYKKGGWLNKYDDSRFTTVSTTTFSPEQKNNLVTNLNYWKNVSNNMGNQNAGEKPNNPKGKDRGVYLGDDNRWHWKNWWNGKEYTYYNQPTMPGSKGQGWDEDIIIKGRAKPKEEPNIDDYYIRDANGSIIGFDNEGWQRDKYNRDVTTINANDLITQRSPIELTQSLNQSKYNSQVTGLDNEEIRQAKEQERLAYLQQKEEEERNKQVIDIRNDWVWMNEEERNAERNAASFRGDNTSLSQNFPVYNPITKKYEQAPRSDAKFSKLWSKDYLREKPRDMTWVDWALLAAPAAVIGAATAPAWVPAVGTALTAPFTIGSTTVPWLTAGNVLSAYGATNSLMNLGNPSSNLYRSIGEAYRNPNVNTIINATGNALETGLGFYGFPAKAGAISLVDDLSRTGRYLTTPLRNTKASKTISQLSQKNYVDKQGLPVVTFDDIDALIEKQINWLDSDEYAIRRMASTGESLNEIRKSTDKWINQIRKNKKDVFRVNPNLESQGEYNLIPDYRNFITTLMGKRKPRIMYRPQDRSNMLNILDHEVLHAFSPALKNDKLYKNYPTLDVLQPTKRTFFEKLFNKKPYTKEEQHLLYLADKPEQQVRGVRLYQKIIDDLDIPEYRPITQKEFDDWIDNYFNKNANKYWDEGLGDVVELLGSAKREADIKKTLGTDKGVLFRKSVLDFLNKVWAIPAAITIGSETLKEKKQGGEINWLTKYDDGGFATTGLSTYPSYITNNVNVAESTRPSNYKKFEIIEKQEQSALNNNVKFVKIKTNNGSYINLRTDSKEYNDLIKNNAIDPYSFNKADGSFSLRPQKQQKQEPSALLGEVGSIAKENLKKLDNKHEETAED